MSDSIIPERPLIISPTLAATIGLDQAVLIHVLSELVLHCPEVHWQAKQWSEISRDKLNQSLPFWEHSKINSTLESLAILGLIETAVREHARDSLLISITKAGSKTEHEKTVQPKTPPRSSSVFDSRSHGKASYIQPSWQPDQDLYRQCQQRNIPREFVDQRIKSFIIYWQERRQAQYSWHHTFLKYICKEWEQERSYQGARELETEMSGTWKPSEEAYAILELGGISHSFIEDAIPEFVLYWRERGVVTSTWSTKFIAHIRRQWAKYNAALEHDPTPKLIPEDYQPSPEVYEVLALANISQEFAQDQLPEFVLYWRERKEVSASWHTKFLQHVKYKWSHRDDRNDQRDFIERVTDRTWAK